jgi:serine/threonine-protein kinase
VSVDTRIGTELAGYKVETLVGRGGMGTVYLAEHLRLRRRVALKLLLPELSEDERFRVRFLRESELAASLDHPNVIPIYDAGEADGLLYLAMRYVEGDDLRAVLDRERRLEPHRALALVRQVAGALDAAHARGLVHRDVKPANVLLDGDHGYLCDFGLTKMVSSISGLTGTGQFIGTIDYVAPEQIQGNLVDGRTDLYSLACLLYECLTGVVPFKRDSEVAVLWAHVQAPPPAVSDKRSDIPQALDAVLAKGLAKNPDERYAACRDFVQAAEQALGVARPGPARAPSALRRRVALLLVPLALLALAALVAVLLLVGRENGSAPSAVRVVPNSVAVVDTKTNKLVAAIRVGRRPGPVAVGAGAVWVGNTGENTLTRIDAATRKVVQTIGLPGTPVDLVFAGGSVWVNADYGDGISRLVPVEPSTNLAGPPVELGRAPLFTVDVTRQRDWLSLAGDADAVWATNPVERTLTKIEASGRVTVKEIASITPQRGSTLQPSQRSSWPVALAVGDASVWSAWYSPGAETNVLTRTSTETSNMTARIKFAGKPDAVAATPSAIWLVEREAHSVWRVDPSINVTTQRIPVRRVPFGLVAGAGDVWVASSDGTISRIDGETNKVVATVKAGLKVVRISSTAQSSLSVARPHPLAVGAGAVWLTVQ